MNNERERLSALVDQELDRDEIDPLLSRICDRPDLREAWDRYHLIGDALRGESGVLRGRSIADGVWARLESEGGEALDGPLPPPRSHPAPPKGRPAWLRASYGYFALAASVLGLAVLVGRGALIPTPSEPLRVASVPAPQYRSYMRGHEGDGWNLDAPRVERRLNRYLDAHQAYSPVGPVKGVVPYVSFAGYEPHH